MTKRLFAYTIVAMLAFAPAVNAGASELVGNDVEERMAGEVEVSVVGSAVYVNGAAGMTMQIVSLTGRVVASVKIESPSQKVDVNVAKGCYILKVGKIVRKVSLS